MRALVVLAAGAVLAAAAGCGGTGSGSAGDGGAGTAGRDAASTEPASPSTSGGSAGPGSAAAPAALRFSARTLDGSTLDMSSLAGRPVVLWFWAPWCSVCRGQAPGVAATAERFDGQVSVVGVAGLDAEAAMKKFVTDRKVGGFPHLSDTGGEVWQRFGVTEQSTFVLLDRAGGVAFRGQLDGDDLAGRVGKLV